MAEKPAKKKMFGGIPVLSQATSVVSGTVGAATNVVGAGAGLVGNVAGTALDVATLGALKTEEDPTETDPLWQMHREPEPVSEKEIEAKKKRKRTMAEGVGAWVDDLAEDYDDEDFRDRVTFLETYLKDKFYGDWYHNAAVIFVTSFFSWLVARLGGGLVWLVIICAFTATYYRTSIIRVRNRVRDDIAREAALVKLETDAETMEWLNSFLVKFWAIYLPSLNDMVIQIANQNLAGVPTPTPIDGVTLSRFTLGSKPPRIDLVRTYPKTEDDVVVMDWGFSFTPNDTADLTSRQLKNKVNPLVELQVRVGKGVISKNLPVLVQDMAFKGLIQIKLKLITTFPHIQTASISFLRQPYFDFVLKPIGGETLGFDINFIPGLDGFIKSMVHDNLGPMLYDPNSFSLNVEQMLAGNPADAAIGVLAVTAYNGRNLRGSDAIGNTVDPYIKFLLGSQGEVGRTSIKSDTSNPRWNETKFFLVRSLTDPLIMEVIDFNDVRKDKKIGEVTFPIERLDAEPEVENQVGKVVHNGKERGDVIFDARFFPILGGKTLEDGTVEPPPQLNTGIMRFTFHQAKDLGKAAKKGFASGGLNPFAKYYLDGKLIHTTRMLKRTNDPVWDEAKEVLITNKTSAMIRVVVSDDKDLSGSSDICSYQISLEELLTENEKANDWFSLSPAGAKCRLSAQWKPVAVKGISGSGGYVKPIGVMRFHLKKATDLRNLETVGKVDPYVRAMVSNYAKNRTVTIHGDLNPEWDEVIYATITSEKEKIALEVMDSESSGKDRSLGLVTLNGQDFIKKNEKGEFVEYIDPTERSAALTMSGRAPKGTLFYTASFFPILGIMDPDDIAAEEKAKKEAEEAEAKLTPEERKKRDEEAAKKAAEEAKKAAEEAKKAPTTVTNGVAPNGAEAAAVVTAEEPKEPELIRMDKDEVLKHDSGLIVFKIIEGSFSKNEVFVQVFFDDFLFPSYVSGRTHGRKAKFEEVGDGFIRELEWSKIHIRVTTKEQSTRDDTEGVIASTTGSTLAHLKSGYATPVKIALQSKEPGMPNDLSMSFKFNPIIMALDPMESHINQGFLKVTLVDATNLPAADRRGKSDPYCVFEMNGEKVYKSQVIKKTLNPSYNESFECSVPSRTKAQFVCNVFDWDMGPAEDDFLGKGLIDVVHLEPMETAEQIITLDGKSGQVRVIVQFRPEYVMRATVGTAALNGTLAVPGKVISAPIKGVGFAAGGVVKGASFFRHGFKSSKDKNGSLADDAASMRSGRTTSKKSVK
ncbi:C2 domain-containing protein [Myxozyma melibiosi]|uniref:C2 domain-containing protein n=1 Tax=Myxozyma melibiosi TaxID=54550 RepID=A0ABR1F390_9ASCO